MDWIFIKYIGWYDLNWRIQHNVFTTLTPILLEWMKMLMQVLF